MAISANIAAAEVTSSVTQRYVGQYFEAALINAPGIQYVPGSTSDSTFMSFEVTPGTAGYEREVFNYTSSDVTQYADKGVAMGTKVTTFPHDGTTTSLNFTHVVMLWGGGNIVSFSAATDEPTSGDDGIYTNLPTVTDGSGRGCLVDLTISNNVFVYTVAKPGNGYAPGDLIGINVADLISAGAVDSSETQSVAMNVSTISAGTNAGQVISVVQPTAAVVLQSGNEATFYWNLKVHGAS